MPTIGRLRNKRRTPASTARRASAIRLSTRKTGAARTNSRGFPTETSIPWTEYAPFLPRSVRKRQNPRKEKKPRRRKERTTMPIARRRVFRSKRRSIRKRIWRILCATWDYCLTKRGRISVAFPCRLAFFSGCVHLSARHHTDSRLSSLWLLLNKKEITIWKDAEQAE